MILLVAAVGAVGNLSPRDFTSSVQSASIPPARGSESIAVAYADPTREALERLSEDKLKAFYVLCSGRSIERRLEGGEAMTCSIGYEVLLSKHFDGDFDGLLAWSRAQAAAMP